MKLMESGEDYLESILMIHNRKGMVRSVDIANELNVSKASVSVAVHNLQEDGYVVIDGHHEICLTEEGRKVAEAVYERHLLFSNLLSSLGVSREVALRDACRMEHAISAESFAALKGYLIASGMGLAEGEGEGKEEKEG